MTKRPVSPRMLLLLAALIVIGWGVGQVFQRTAPLGRDVGASEIAKAALLPGTRPVREVADATLTLVVFTDYQCPACKRADPEMERALAKDGHVRVVYVDWPVFGPLSERAARVALAADRQGVYPAVHSGLMAEDRPLTDHVLSEVVERAGGDWSRLQRDLVAHGPEIERELGRNRQSAFGLGIPGTPAYLAGPVLIKGALDEAEFRRVFAEGRAAMGS